MMRRILHAVDPSVRATGFAEFSDGELDSATLYRAATVIGAVEHSRRRPYGYATEIVVEVPRVYPHGKGDPNDLVDVAIVAGAWLSRCPSPTTVYPAQWKGQVPKDVMAQRIRSRLTGGELAVLDASLAAHPAALRHNVYDAVGIGLYHLRRL